MKRSHYMKTLLRSLAFLFFAFPALADPFAGSTANYQIYGDQNNNIQMVDYSTGPVSLLQLTAVQNFIANSGGGVTISTNVIITGNTTHNGRVASPAVALTGLTGGTTWQIPVTSSYLTILSTGTNVPLNGLPTISTATAVGGSTPLADGTYLVIGSTGCPIPSGVFTSSITLQSDNAGGGMAGTRLRLGAATRVISCNKSIGLMYDAAATAWKELWYSNVP